MTTRSLTEYTCDGCETVVVARSRPVGWVNMLSTSASDHRPLKTPVRVRIGGHHDMTIEPGLIWCGSECLMLWLASKIDVLSSRQRVRHG